MISDAMKILHKMRDPKERQKMQFKIKLTALAVKIRIQQLKDKAKNEYDKFRNS